MNAEALALDRPRAADYLALTKPGITVMVVVTAALGYLSASTAPGLSLLHLLVGIALASAGSAALNMVLERDMDAKMERTAGRPIPAGRILPNDALLFGSILCAVGMTYLTILVHPLAGGLTAATVVTYAFVYTPLKRRTSLCTFVGAVPGALPPVIGWAAAEGGVGTGAWILFLILFFWQIPHFLAIAWLYRDDYARAGFPMLTAADPDGTATGRQVLLQTTALMAASLAPVAAGMAGRLYLAGSLVLGTGFFVLGFLFALSPGRKSARRLFFGSIVYLPVQLALLAFGG